MKRMEISDDSVLETKREYHREYNRPYMKQWRKDNPDKIKQIYKKTRGINRLAGLIRCTRQTAKKRGLDHTITTEDLAKTLVCPLTGIEIDWDVGTGRHMKNPSIDRIDPEKGYVPGNVEVMSCLGNTMKCNATPEQLLFFAKEILKRYGTNL